ncbi:hypothetical protein TELCIR_11614 [Teladorsagia circumcincta]|uniref:Uncharacterized protein n=1 Tax=Teladorsagia circumcincta TaxID=45464 RepID=A0A2G9U905_TELCI|nr:hypothetical protein TELCIR_11614 [Teladorsagia circumcincta]
MLKCEKLVMRRMRLRNALLIVVEIDDANKERSSINNTRGDAKLLAPRKNLLEAGLFGRHPVKNPLITAKSREAHLDGLMLTRTAVAKGCLERSIEVYDVRYGWSQVCATSCWSQIPSKAPATDCEEWQRCGDGAWHPPWQSTR